MTPHHTLFAAAESLKLPHYLLLLLLSSILVAGLRVWLEISRRWMAGQDLVPLEPRRPVPWGLADICLSIVLWITIFIALLSAGQQWFGVPKMATDNNPEMLMPLMLLDSMAKLLATGLMFLIIHRRTRCSWNDLGLSAHTIPSDLFLGLLAFVALAIPTYLVQVALVQIWPSKHPLVEMLEHDPQHQVLLTAIFMAVGCAPLVEEFFFRVLFQGWLEKLFNSQVSRWPDYGESILWGGLLVPPPSEQLILAELADESEVNDFQKPVTAFDNPYVPSLVANPQSELPADSSCSPTSAYVSIGISSLIFALMHFLHGPDWIALLILAAGLGYLYHRTHRLLPCLTVHFLLNGTSMVMLILGIWGGGK
jgi:membrane protease YdiL (CAAX protease family)